MNFVGCGCLIVSVNGFNKSQFFVISFGKSCEYIGGVFFYEYVEDYEQYIGGVFFYEDIECMIGVFFVDNKEFEGGVFFKYFVNDVFSDKKNSGVNGSVCNDFDQVFLFLVRIVSVFFYCYKVMLVFGQNMGYDMEIIQVCFCDCLLFYNS